MDILLHHGDHARNAQGFLEEVAGAPDYIQQAMIRLSVPQGSFALDKTLEAGCMPCPTPQRSDRRNWRWSMRRRRCCRFRMCG